MNFGLFLFPNSPLLRLMQDLHFFLFFILLFGLGAVLFYQFVEVSLKYQSSVNSITMNP